VCVIVKTFSLSVFVLALLFASPVVAQDPSSPKASPSAIDGPGSWQPLGLLPVDQAGAGRRGYAISGESADVAEPGASELSLHTVAANNFYRNQTDPFSISQRDESHTVALGYRRGFTLGRLPRVELGGQIQLHERDSGFMNGFISGFESLWVSMTGATSAKNLLRTATSPVPLGTLVTHGDRLLYQTAGDSSGFGDLRVIAKTLLHHSASAAGPRVTARVVVNVSGASAFSEGNFAGIGVGIDHPLSPRIAFHGDVRAGILLDRVSSWNLPLKRATFGFSAGPELKLGANSSVGLQFDGNTTPYQPTGSAAFDESYGSITFGLSHRVRTTRTPLLVQAYARENLNLPFSVRWNTDPDLAVGVKITVQIPKGQRNR
jgi:hypothetical protein